MVRASRVGLWADPRKGVGKEAKLSFMGHVLTENRNGLVVETELTHAIAWMPGRAAINGGATPAQVLCVLRVLTVTPHIAQNLSGRRSAIDCRTTRHPGYGVSQQKRKRVEEPFGWGKMIGGLGRPMLRGVKKLGFKFTLTMASYNLIRLPKLIAALA